MGDRDRPCPPPSGSRALAGPLPPYGVGTRSRRFPEPDRTCPDRAFGVPGRGTIPPGRPRDESAGRHLSRPLPPIAPASGARKPMVAPGRWSAPAWASAGPIKWTGRRVRCHGAGERLQASARNADKPPMSLSCRTWPQVTRIGPRGGLTVVRPPGFRAVSGQGGHGSPLKAAAFFLSLHSLPRKPTEGRGKGSPRISGAFGPLPGSVRVFM
jgi:hypothetical protein